jgi:CRP/FNR family transcriptional regulator, anaerobic regulatory protein
MLDNLYSVFNKTMPLSKEDKMLCEHYFKPLSMGRNSVLEEEGKVPKYLYFVNSGFMRLFYYDQNGDEVTTHLASPNDFIASFLNLIHQKPSTENVECVTECQVLRVTRDSMLAFIDKSDNFKKISLAIFEHAIASSQIRANDLATLTAELRYKKLIEERPEILQNMPIQYIASYLGIKPQSLSRIRKQMIK